MYILTHYDAHSSEISHRYKLLLCAMLMSRICRRFIEGKKPYTALELRKETSIPIRFVKDLVYELTEAGMLIEVTSDEKGEESRFMPAEDVRNMTLGMMIDRLEANGAWKIDLELGKLMGQECKKAIEMRSAYLRNAREIMLQDL